MQVGHRIYFDSTAGTVHLDTGEMQGDVTLHNQTQDFAAYPQLRGIDPATVSFIDLDYGAQAAQFAAGNVTNVDTTTHALTFTPFA